MAGIFVIYKAEVGRQEASVAELDGPAYPPYRACSPLTSSGRALAGTEVLADGHTISSIATAAKDHPCLHSVVTAFASACESVTEDGHELGRPPRRTEYRVY